MALLGLRPLRRALIIVIHLLNPIVAIQPRLTTIRPMKTLAQAAIPVFDLFYDFPVLHLDMAVDTGDERVRDEDGPLPPATPFVPYSRRRRRCIPKEAIHLQMVVSYSGLVNNFSRHQAFLQTPWQNSK